MQDREVWANGGKRPGYECCGVGEGCGAELGGAVIFPVEQVVDLNEKLQPLVNLVAAAEIEDRVSRRHAWPKVVDPISLMRVVFVSSGEGIRESLHAEIHSKFRCDTDIREGFHHVL